LVTVEFGKKTLAGAALLALAAGALWLGGCGMSEDVTGIWKTRDAPVRISESVSQPRHLDECYLFLAIAQYGHEVAGVMWCCDTPSFDGENCSCSYVYNGLVRGSRLTFLFDALPPTAEGARLRAELNLLGEDEIDIRLSGHLYLIETVEPPQGTPQSPEESAYASLTLEGTRQVSIPDYFLLCEPDPASGGGGLADGEN